MLKVAYWGYPILSVPAAGARRDLALHLPQSEFERYAAYRGHVPPSFAERVPNPFVFTFLREPRERLVSHYYYHRSLGLEKLSLTKFLESDAADNIMTRAIAGEPSAEAAIEVLSTMDFIGLTERFDDDTERLFALLGRRSVPPLRWKPTHIRLELEDLAPSVLTALEERTAEDRAVYAWALSQR